MRTTLGPFGLRFTSGHALWFTVVATLGIALVLETHYTRLGITLLVVTALVTAVTFRGRRLTGWVAAIGAWFSRTRRPPDPPSEPVVGNTVKPGDHVAVRWQGDFLVGLIELIPRPFTPTVVVDGHAHTDDVVDTRLLAKLIAINCPDLEADVVSAGYRVATAAPPDVVNLYEQVIGPDPAPANRRTWVLLRAAPADTRKSAALRAEGVAGLAKYVVASTTRIADQLASNGVDAVCARSFDDFDHATEVSFVREKWSKIRGRDNYTVAYASPDGPDAWWSARADHTITRVRVVPGMPPRATVLLTTKKKPKKPRGFTRLSGSQRSAIQDGQTLVPNTHCQLPIGSAGVFVGETLNRNPVYMPFDDVDVSLNLGDAQTFTQFAVRATAAGAHITLGPQFGEFAGMINAETGGEAKVGWPHATTYLGPHAGTERVNLAHNRIGTPRHRELPIRAVCPPEENRYQMVVQKPGTSRVPPPYRRRWTGQRDRMGVAALVLGIVGLATSVSVVLGVVLGLAAVIFGVIAFRRVQPGEGNNRRIAIAGMTLGVLAIIAGLVFIFVWLRVFHDASKDFTACINEAGQNTAERRACLDRFGRDIGRDVQERLDRTPTESPTSLPPPAPPPPEFTPPPEAPPEPVPEPAPEPPPEP